MSLTQHALHDRRLSGLSRLTLRLTAARFASRQGESLLYFAGILAYTIATALGLTVAGGTWLFWNRWQHPTGLIAEVLAQDPSFDIVLLGFFALAIIASSMLVPSIVNLASDAAVLGARGRERRLSALRLLGLSSGDVVRMSLLDAMIQALFGVVLGATLYAVTLPLWSNLTMLGMELSFAEMWLPPWLAASVIAALVVIGLFAAWRGLRLVRISPLGVARRANKPALSWIRAIVFVVVLTVAVATINVLRPGSEIGPWLIFGGILVSVIIALNLVSPWILQVSARLWAQLPWPSIKWAARRIVADPAATWRRVAGMSLLSFIGGFMSTMPVTIADKSDAGGAVQTFAEATQWDLTKGVIIALAVGFVLTATSMLITQASATIERAEQSRALRRMGAPTGFSLRTMWLETFGPLALAVLSGAVLGVVMASPMLALMRELGIDPSSGIRLIAGVLLCGLGLAAASLLASHPLYFSLLGRSQRRND